MPIQQQYYINGTTLSNASGIFLDQAFTVIPPDGYYSDGVVVRHLADGILGPPFSCPSCAIRNCITPVGLTPPTYIASGGNKGIYKTSIGVGSGIGAVVLKFSNFGSAVGILATYNSSTYNKLSIEDFGVAQAPSGLPTYYGIISGSCKPATNSPYYIQEYVDSGTLSGSFSPTPIFSTVNVLNTQEFNTITMNPAPVAVMVIPKLTAAPSVVDLDQYLVCDNLYFSFLPLCPAPLPWTYGSATISAGGFGSCNQPLNKKYYIASVGGTSLGGNVQLGLYDYVFLDPNGQTPAADGWYASPVSCPDPNDVFRVQNGVIVEFSSFCQSQFLAYESANTYTGCANPGLAYTTSFNLKWDPLNITKDSQTTFPLVNGSPLLSLEPGVYTATLSVTFTSVPSGSCPQMKIGMSSSQGTCAPIPMTYSPPFTPAVGQTLTFSYTFSHSVNCWASPPPPYPTLGVRIMNA